MFDKLKHALNAVKAFVSGASAYLTTLFTTPGEFSDARSAANRAYNNAYQQSMDRSEPSLRGAARHAVRGDLRGTLNQVRAAVSDTFDRAAESLPSMNAHDSNNRPHAAADRARADAMERAQAAQAEAAREERHVQRREATAARNEALRRKHKLPKAKEASSFRETEEHKRAASATPKGRSA